MEAIARSLKLMPKYIEALENENFDAFPAPPYIRVYLRAVAKHLMLDPDEVLQMYYHQSGVPAHERGESRKTRVDISVERHSRPKARWPLIVILVFVLGGIAFMYSRMNANPNAQADEEVVPGDSASTTLPVPQDGDSSASADMPADSAGVEKASPPPPEPEPKKDEPEAATEPAPPDATRPDSLVLVMTALKESAWVQVFTDGRSRMGFIPPGKSRVYRAVDSLNVHVGYNGALRYALNGQKIRPSNNKGVAMFKIDHDGTTGWTAKQWNKVFAERL